jgi:hypothetical protein
MEGILMLYFIGGFPRTGTTMVAANLCSAPDVNGVTAECSYIEFLMFAYEAIQISWKANALGFWTNLQELNKTQAEVIQVFTDHVKERHGVEKLVLARPFMARWFPTLAGFFPESHYVVTVRDPRDVLGSLKRVKREHYLRDLKTQEQHPFLDQSLPEFCYAYVRGVIECLEEGVKFPGRFHFVKYEDLVSDPDGYYETLGELLDLDLSDYDSAWEERIFPKDNPFHSKDWGKKVTNKNVGKYLTQLDKEEIDMVTHICSPLMEVFGYE